MPARFLLPKQLYNHYCATIFPQVRALRQELEGREKALELARRTVERLSGEKGQLEATAAGAVLEGTPGACAAGRGT